MLTRSLEAEGLSIILVTMMPYWAEKIGTPRTLAVEFPFGHALGMPHDREQQRRVVRQALDVLQTTDTPGTIVHSTEQWSQAELEAIQIWQPSEPSPIVSMMSPYVRKLLRERRRKKSS